MPRDFRQPSPPVFPRREFFRLTSMVMLLVVVGMLIYRTGDPAMWRWLADDAVPDPAAQACDGLPNIATQSERGDTREPAKFDETLVTGPNDLQPFEHSQAEYQFQAISDKTPLSAEEMPAYWRVMRWSMTQTFDELWERARRDLYFTHLAQDPAKYRGELVAMKVSLRRTLAHEASKNSEGVKQVYEAWGVTEESRTGLYCLLFYDKPPELAVSPSVHEEALFVGYFLKLFAYEDALGKSRWAPVLIGRLHWRENVARAALRRQRDERGFWPWAIGGAALFIVGIALWTKRYLNPAELAVTAPPVDHGAIEHWLETGGESVPLDRPAEFPFGKSPPCANETAFDSGEPERPASWPKLE